MRAWLAQRFCDVVQRSSLSRARIVAVLVVMMGWGCASDHRVSPWPGQAGLGALLRAGTLDEHLARVRKEMAAEKLEKEAEIRGSFESGLPFVILGYMGSGGLGYPRYAVRVATRHGVVFAVGPNDTISLMAGNRTRLVEALTEGIWRSGSDINGDEMPDVVVRGWDGTLEVWGLHAKGASPYPMRGIVAPTWALDVNSDGLPELAGWVVPWKNDPIAPRIQEVMAFSKGAYTYDTDAVRAYHASRSRTDTTASVEEKGTPPPQPRSTTGEQGSTEPGARKLAEELERAWHAIRAGQPSDRILRKTDRTVGGMGVLPSDLREAWRRWRRWLDRIGGARKSKDPKARPPKPAATFTSRQGPSLGAPPRFVYTPDRTPTAPSFRSVRSRNVDPSPQASHLPRHP